VETTIFARSPIWMTRAVAPFLKRDSRLRLTLHARSGRARPRALAEHDAFTST
jgi:hypothetical protein